MTFPSTDQSTNDDSKRKVEASVRFIAERRRQATYQRVSAAIDSLVARRSPVSLSAISRETSVLDPDLPPIAASTICRNEAARELYRQHAKPNTRDRVRYFPAPPPRMLRQSKVKLASALISATAMFDQETARNAALVRENARLLALLRLNEEAIAQERQAHLAGAHVALSDPSSISSRAPTRVATWFSFSNFKPVAI